MIHVRGDSSHQCVERGANRFVSHTAHATVTPPMKTQKPLPTARQKLYSSITCLS